jgi:hypothetical protein
MGPPRSGFLGNDPDIVAVTNWLADTEGAKMGAQPAARVSAFAKALFARFADVVLDHC